MANEILLYQNLHLIHGNNVSYDLLELWLKWVYIVEILYKQT